MVVSKPLVSVSWESDVPAKRLFQNLMWVAGVDRREPPDAVFLGARKTSTPTTHSENRFGCSLSAALFGRSWGVAARRELQPLGFQTAVLADPETIGRLLLREV